MKNKVNIKTKFKLNSNFFKNEKAKQPLITFSKKMKGKVTIENQGNSDIFVFLNGQKTSQIHPSQKNKIESHEIESISIRCEPSIGKKCKGIFKFEEE